MARPTTPAVLSRSACDAVCCHMDRSSPMACISTFTTVSAAASARRWSYSTSAATAPETTRLFWQLYLRCQIAADRVDQAGSSYLELPRGLRTSAELQPFQMYFDVLDGKDANEGASSLEA